MLNDNNFDKAVDYVLQNEGGFADIPEDRGGPTNYGITQGDLAEWRGCSVSAEDVRNMKVEEAKAIYKKKYWSPISCDQLTQLSVAICMFDSGVLYGLNTGAKYAQQSANVCGSHLQIDGHIGPESVASLNAVDHKGFISAFHGLLLARIQSIIAHNPSQIKFEAGWKRRADRLLTLV